MSDLYLATGDNTWLDDLGSAFGYSQFIDWARTLDSPAVTEFIDTGETTNLPEFIKALEGAKAPDESVDATRVCVLDAAKKADGNLICAAE